MPEALNREVVHIPSTKTKFPKMGKVYAWNGETFAVRIKGRKKIFVVQIKPENLAYFERRSNEHGAEKET